MIQTTKLSLAILAFAISAHSFAAWNPSSGWKDSYSVNGKCYCDSNGYDHGLHKKTAMTPIGKKNVVQICNDIKEALGTGPSSNRIPYNDIQCGNGPANDAPDEAGCPGRVDIGSAGCNQIGPKWDLESVYGAKPPTQTPEAGTLNRSGWILSASHDGSNVYNAIDNMDSTRWATKETQRNGQSFEVDLRSSQSFNKIVLTTAANPSDYPRGYQVFVSNNGSNWGSSIATGSGNNSTTIINFSTVNARYLKIVQTGKDSKRWWSIHEINLHTNGTGSSPALPTTNPTTPNGKLNSSNWSLSGTTNQDISKSIDGNDKTRWTTRQKQSSGQYFEIDMKKMENFNHIVLDTMSGSASVDDHPRGYKVYTSSNGTNWGSPVATGAGNSSGITTIDFNNTSARYIKIVQTGSDNYHWWSIHELSVYSK